MITHILGFLVLHKRDFEGQSTRQNWLVAALAGTGHGEIDAQSKTLHVWCGKGLERPSLGCKKSSSVGFEEFAADCH